MLPNSAIAVLLVLNGSKIDFKVFSQAFHPHEDETAIAITSLI